MRRNRIAPLHGGINNEGTIIVINEYHLPDGNPVTVNLAAIAYVQRTADQTLITFIGGAMLTVAEPYEEVSGAHTRERQVGFGMGG